MKKKLEASYTVEAALILPVVFALLYGVIFLGFYLHDSTVMEQYALEGAFYGVGKQEKVLESEIDYYVRSRLEGHLLVTELKSSRITREKNYVSVELSGKADRLGFAEALLGYRQETGILAERKVSYPCAPDYVRKGLIICEQMKKIWEDG